MSNRVNLGAAKCLMPANRAHGSVSPSCTINLLVVCSWASTTRKEACFFIIMRAVCLSMEFIIATGIIWHACCFIVFWGTSHLQIFLPMSDPLFYMYECEFMSLFADEFEQFSVGLLALLSDILLGYLYINLLILYSWKLSWLKTFANFVV